MKRIYTWLYRFVLLIALVAFLVIAHTLTTSLQGQIVLDKFRLDNTPNEALYVADVQSDLSKREFDLGRIRAFVPARDTIIEVVSAIEGEGDRRDVIVAVPGIEEEFVRNQEGQAILPPGPLRGVRLKLSAFGEPDDLMKFLHGVEHLPYVIHLDTWDLQIRPVRAGQGLASSIQGQAPGSIVASATLNAEAIVFIEKPNNED